MKNTERFKSILLPYSDQLYRIAYRILREKEEAENAVQDAYLKLWEKRDVLSDIDNLKAYATVILRNSCLDKLKKKKETLLEDYHLNLNESDSLVKTIEINDSLSKVRKLIDELPKNEREVMILYHWNDLNDEEIEKITGIKTGTVRVMISRARKKIKEQYSNRFEL